MEAIRDQQIGTPNYLVEQRPAVTDLVKLSASAVAGRTEKSLQQSAHSELKDVLKDPTGQAQCRAWICERFRSERRCSGRTRTCL